MKRANNVNSKALRWLIIVAMLFAPLQNAFSMLDHSGMSTSAMMMDNDSCHDKITTNSNISESDCCDEQCAQNLCSNTCSSLHPTVFAASAICRLHDNAPMLFRKPPSNVQLGRVTTPLLRPPQE